MATLTHNRYRRWIGWTWLVPAGLAGGAWLEAGDPGRYGGLAVAVGLACIGWPLAVVGAFFTPTWLPAGLAPRRWRKRYRRRLATRKRNPLPREEQASSRIPDLVERFVSIAWGHRCAAPACRARIGLQVDHVFPWSLGGLSTPLNCSLLCGPHNRVKSNYWEFSGGARVYRPFKDADNLRIAQSILRRERLQRLNIARWLYAAWMLLLTDDHVTHARTRKAG